MSKAKEYMDYNLNKKSSYDIAELHLQIVKVMEHMNHKTLEDVKEWAEKRVKESVVIHLTDLLTQLEKLKL